MDADVKAVFTKAGALLRRMDANFDMLQQMMATVAQRGDSAANGVNEEPYDFAEDTLATMFGESDEQTAVANLLSRLVATVERQEEDAILFGL